MTARRTSRGKLKAVAPREIPAMPGRMLGPRPLKDREFRDAVGAVDFAVDARYAWDAGIAVSEYLRGLKAGRILARSCRQCRRILVPPRMFCEQCFRPTDRWLQVRDTGRVNTFSICYIRWDMEPLREPELPAVIEIDGASPGMGFMHKLGEVEPDAVAVGLEVEAVWKPEEEREGSILDIRYFRPRDPARRAGPRRPSGRRAPGRRKKAAGGGV
ncbi:MAG TPA: Zn-ribbon domain-containing OB-fold protein [Actinomycetota bacterium]|nr:Zn-ribbon domain-containing OB-fold protein [Actinomycetota bacterium]